MTKTMRHDCTHPSDLGELLAILEMSTMVVLLLPRGRWSWIRSEAELLAALTVQAARDRTFPLLDRLEMGFATALDELQRATTPSNATDDSTPMQFEELSRSRKGAGRFLEILMTNSLLPSFFESPTGESLFAVRQAVVTVVRQMDSTDLGYFIVGRRAAGFRKPWVDLWTEPEFTQLADEAATLLQEAVHGECKGLVGHSSAEPHDLARSEELERGALRLAKAHKHIGAGAARTDEDAASVEDRSRLIESFKSLLVIVRSRHTPESPREAAATDNRRAHAPRNTGDHPPASGHGRSPDPSTKQESEDGREQPKQWRPPKEVLQGFGRISPLTEKELRERGLREFVARSEPARRAATAVLRYLKNPGPILVVAPSGSGKEMLMRDLHRIHSRIGDAEGPPHVLPCSSMNTEPGFCQLVGVEKGVATGVSPRQGVLETVGEGLLVLDEFHALDLHRQIDLLRILDPDNPDYAPVGSSETRKRVRAMIVACTSENLWELADRGAFNKPLLKRFAGRVVWIPPLHERREDIIGLCERIWSNHDPEVQHCPAELEAVADLIVVHRWDGRELRAELEDRWASSEPKTVFGMFPEIRSKLGDRDSQRSQLVGLMKRHRGNVKEAASEYYPNSGKPADTLRVSLRRLLQSFGIDPSQYKTPRGQ